jgi:hypothetical protein
MRRARRSMRRAPAKAPEMHHSNGERAIVISAEPFGCGFDVRVEPPMPDGRDYGQELPSIRRAREYAASLRDELRLPVRDRGGA